jgi:hypothetical protein
MNTAVRSLSYLAIATALAGCGGGSSGGGGSSPSLSGTPVTITTANGDEVAGEVATAADSAVGTGNLGPTMLPTAVVISGGPDTPSLAEVARDQLARAAEAAASAAPHVASGILIEDSIDCSGGGRIVFSFDDADDDLELSSGDTMSIDFRNCVETGLTMDGGMSLTGVSITGDYTLEMAGSFAAAFDFNNLSMSFEGQTMSIDGDMSISSSTADGITLATDVSGQSLTLSAGVDTVRLESYVFSSTEDGMGYSLEETGRLLSSALDGSVQFETLAPLTGFDIELDYPSGGGPLVITGAAGGTVTLTPQGGDMVEVAIDTNGDDSPESIQTLTWDELTAM